MSFFLRLSPQYLSRINHTSAFFAREYIEKITLQDVCKYMMCMHQGINPKHDCYDFYVVYSNYLRYVLADFIRDYDDKKYPQFKLARHTEKSFKSQIKSESKLLGKLWELIRLLSHYFYNVPIPFIFFEIVKENDLAFFIFCRKQEAATQTVREWRKTIQNQNSTLAKLDSLSAKNLFNKNESPSTFGFLQLCFFEADKNDSFRSHYFEFVKLRARHTTIIFENHPNVYDKKNPKIERRGRKY